METEYRIHRDCTDYRIGNDGTVGTCFRPVGERHGMHRLGQNEVREIRKLYATGTITQKSLARQFGVCKQQISRIVRGERWPENAA